MGTIVLVLIVGILAGMAFVRLAPSDPARWHVPIKGAQDKDGGKFALRVLSADAGTMKRIHDAMMDLPRTRILAGDPATGSVTYVTRSRLVGFPDYTTVEQTGNLLKLYARSRFAGGSDLGVNRRRLEQVLAAAQAG